MSDKNNYIVCEFDDPEVTQSLGFLKIVKKGFASTRDAEKWIRDEASDGLEYVVVKITRTVRVETVTRRKLTKI